MVKATVRKSDVFVEASFAKPAFSLLRADSSLNPTVVTALSKYCSIRGNDIRVETDTNPIGNAGVVYDLRPLNGFSRVSLDRATILFVDPHTQETQLLTDLSQAFLHAVQECVDDSLYEAFQVTYSLHAQLDTLSPANYVQNFVASLPDDGGPVIGNAVTYIFGQQGPCTNSAIAVEMSAEFSQCVFVRLSATYDAAQHTNSVLTEQVRQRFQRLLYLVGLEIDK